MPDVQAALRGYARIFEAALPDTLPRGKTPVEQAMRYSMEGGGKRIRPALVLSFCELFGGKTEQVLPLAVAMPFAVALEMIHCYSLIHDDLPCMDNDDYRRGQLSCHRKFGEAAALLAGDALLTLAFETIAGAEMYPAELRCKAIALLARAAGTQGMIGGQWLDIQYERRKITRSQLEEMNRRKTGALLGAACELGCLAASADKIQTVAALAYAEHLGLLFQLTDDILDADEEPGKATWVSLLGLEGAQTEARLLAQSAQKAIAPYAGKDHFLHDLPEWLILRNA